MSNITNPIPEPLYRLRIEVLKDKVGAYDCPEKVFSFPNQPAQQEANAAFRDAFGVGFSEYSITDGSEGSEGDAGLDVEDGRTDLLRLSYDSVTADESWKEFLGRLKVLEGKWTKDT